VQHNSSSLREKGRFSGADREKKNMILLGKVMAQSTHVLLVNYQDVRIQLESGRLTKISVAISALCQMIGAVIQTCLPIVLQNADKQAVGCNHSSSHRGGK